MCPSPGFATELRYVGAALALALRWRCVSFRLRVNVNSIVLKAQACSGEGDGETSWKAVGIMREVFVKRLACAVQWS